MFFTLGRAARAAALSASISATLACASAPPAALPTLAPTPPPLSKAKPAVPASYEDRAVAIAQRFSKGEFAGIAADFDEAMTKALPASRIEKVWKDLVDQVGPLEEVAKPRRSEAPPHVVVSVGMRFRATALDLKVAYDVQGKVAGLGFAPAEDPATASAPPSYANPEAFREEDVTIGSGEWAVPGTLTLPAAPKDGKAAPFPAVILVHGSGPQDRDETIGPNKVFRDLAWGLASRGVAVLRYEKRTKVHGAKLANALATFTVKEETVADAVEAATVLRQRPEIDAKRVYVLGHSLGGMLAPRIAKADPKLAGLVIFAGATRPIADLVVEQFLYLAGLDGKVSPEEQTRIDAATKDAERIRKREIKEGELVLGAPASYWLDLAGYDAPAEAARLKLPLLVLQGDRDYQVTKADLDGWKKRLGKKKQVTFKSYPTLNHLFVAGEGKSTPEEYGRPGHVDEAVIADIVAWIQKKR